MAIKVNRFNVRYKGISYGPGKEAGQIIEGLSEEEESRLIRDSNGTIVYLEETNPVIDNKMDFDETTPENTGVQKVNIESENMDAQDVNPDDITIDQLIKLGVQYPNEAERPELYVFQDLLQPMTKRQLLIYADAAGIEVNDRMKNAEIIQVISEVAIENGINLEAMTDEQLLEFGLALGGKNITVNTSRDELLEASRHLLRLSDE